MQGDSGRRRRSRSKLTMIVLTLALAIAPASVHGQSPTPSPRDEVEAAAEVPFVTPHSSESAWARALIHDTGRMGFFDMASWHGGFVAIGRPPRFMTRKQGTNVPVWLSPDGSEWERGADIPLPSKRADVTHVIEFRKKLYAFGSEGLKLLVWRSKDGKAWRRLKHVPVFESHGRNGYVFQVNAVVVGHGSLVVNGMNHTRGGDTASYPRAWVTSDGKSWRTAGDGVSREGSEQVWAPHAVVGPSGVQAVVGKGPMPAGCGTESGVAAWSAQGLRWHRVSEARPVCGLESLAYDPVTDRFFGLALDQGPDDFLTVTLLRSKDRRTWREVLRIPQELQGEFWWSYSGEIFVEDGAIVVLGEGEWIAPDENIHSQVWTLVSTDRREWRLEVTPREQPMSIRTMAFGHGRIVTEGWFADIEDLAS